MSLQALVNTLVHQGLSKSTSQAQCAGIPSNVTSGTSVYISTSRSIKVNKSGIVCRVYHQTSLQALVFTLVHRGPSKSTSQAQCAGYTIKRHFKALVFTLVHQGPSKSTSQAQCAGYTIKRHFRHFCLHQYIKVYQSQQVRHSVQGIPSNVTSSTCAYISTSRSIKVNKSGIVCRVYHQTSLQTLVFTLVHQGPSKSTSQA